MRMLQCIFATALVIAGSGACNHQDACPTDSKGVGDGMDCTSEGIQCEYDVMFTDCDGVKQVIASSCTCTSGKWSCPSEPDCPMPGDEGGGDEGGTE